MEGEGEVNLGQKSSTLIYKEGCCETERTKSIKTGPFPIRNFDLCPSSTLSCYPHSFSHLLSLLYLLFFSSQSPPSPLKDSN